MKGKNGRFWMVIESARKESKTLIATGGEFEYAIGKPGG